MANEMNAVVEEAWANRALPLNSPQELLTLASIVEKTAIPSERTVIASVFINRLNKGMRLQANLLLFMVPVIMLGILPTLIYVKTMHTIPTYTKVCHQHPLLALVKKLF